MSKGQKSVEPRGLSRGPYQRVYKSPGQVSTVSLPEQSGGLNVEHPEGALVKKTAELEVERSGAIHFLYLLNMCLSCRHSRIPDPARGFCFRYLKINSVRFTPFSQIQNQPYLTCDP